MKIHFVLALATAAGALAAHAAAQQEPALAGTVRGGWTEVATGLVTVDAPMVVNKASVPAYRLTAVVLGTGHTGAVEGAIDQLPLDPKEQGSLVLVQYLLSGEWIELDDGGWFVHSQILLDLKPWGTPVQLPVGVLDGELFGIRAVSPLTDPSIVPLPGSSPQPLATQPGAQEIDPIEPTPKPRPPQPIDPTPKPLDQRTGKFIGQWALY